MGEIVKDGNFFVLPGWMGHPEMGLKGVELKLFAIVYGYSQGDDQYCTASVDYLAQFTGASQRSIINSIRALQLKGYITAEEIVRNREYKLKACDVPYHLFKKIEGRRVKAHSYFTVFGWMVRKDRMALKDLELLVYAQVYALSQGQPCICGSKYIADSVGASERAVRYALVKLAEKGYLKRKAIGINRYVYEAIVPKALEKISADLEKISADLEKISAPWKKLPTYNKANNKANNKCDKRQPSFKNFNQRDYDYGELEKAMLNRMQC